MGITWRDIRFYLRLVRRRLWIFVLLVLISAAISASMIRSQPRLYVTATVLRVGNAFSSASPDLNGIQIGTTLTLYYAELARRETIVAAALQRNGIDLPPELVAGQMLGVRPMPQSQLLEITVVDTDPERAARIANAIGDELIRQSPATEDAILQERQFANERIQKIKGLIAERDAQIADLQQRIQSVTSSAEISDLNNQLDLLEKDRAALEESYQNYYWIITRSSENSLSRFQPALVPATPMPPKTFFSVLLAAAMGGTLAIVGLLAMERLENRWSIKDDVELLLGLPVLATLPVQGALFDERGGLSTGRGRAIRELQTALLLHSAKHPFHTLLVTSTRGNATRARVTEQLARVFARSGQDIVLVNSWNEGPADHALLAASPGEAGTTSLALPIEQMLQPTDDPVLRLLPGMPGSDSPDMIPSLRWASFAQALNGVGDLCLFDGPPALTGADATLLAGHVDVVLLVTNPSYDGRRDIKQAIQRLRQNPKAKLLGLVVEVDPPRPRWRLFRRRKALPPAPAAPEDDQD